MVTPAKRESVLSGTDEQGKINKLNEFNDNTLIPLEPTDTRMDTEWLFDSILRNPLCSVKPDGSLYCVLSHIFLGNQEYHDIYEKQTNPEICCLPQPPL